MRSFSRSEIQRLAHKKRVTTLLLFAVICGSAIASGM